MAPSKSKSSRSGVHVARVSHQAGGGHATPKALGIVAKAARNPGSWDAGVPIEEDDSMTAVHPLYQGMKFPDYEYREFPKMVGDKVANNEEEEAVLLAGKPLMREPEERVRLLKVAEVKNVTIDKRWNIEKIVKAIQDAGFDPDLDPFK